MSQNYQENQQIQEQENQNKSKKKHKSKKQQKANELENADVATGGSETADNKVPCDKKQPLHASMEQLQMATAAKAANVSRRAAGSNWEKQRQSLSLERKKSTASSAVDEQEDVATAAVHAEESSNENNTQEVSLSKAQRLRAKRKAAQRNKYVAMDCEMVGVGYNGDNDMLARVSIVSKAGEVLLDKFVKPQEEVVNYRTSVSGIRPHDIQNGEDFDVVQNEVIEILQGKILVGHSIRSDLAVLRIKHPFANIRDTARYKPLCRLVANGRTPSLKRLSHLILGLEIQTGEHNSIEDARAAMSIYNRLSSDWEKYIRNHQSRK